MTLLLRSGRANAPPSGLLHWGVTEVAGMPGCARLPSGARLSKL